MDELRNTKIPIKGDDLLAIGFEQGKKLKDALDYAIEVVIENNKIEKKDLIKRIVYFAVLSSIGSASCFLKKLTNPKTR